MIFLGKRIFLAFLLAGFAGCSTVDVEEAFKGKLAPIKGNKTINNYCQSCHIHKDFNPGEHVFAVRKKYKQSFYRNAQECRICHYIKKIWARNTMKRKTRHPYGVDRGLFKEFEQDEMKKEKKNKKQRKSL